MRPVCGLIKKPISNFFSDKKNILGVQTHYLNRITNVDLISTKPVIFRSYAKNTFVSMSNNLLHNKFISSTHDVKSNLTLLSKTTTFATHLGISEDRCSKIGLDTMNVKAIDQLHSENIKPNNNKKKQNRNSKRTFKETVVYWWKIFSTISKFNLCCWILISAIPGFFLSINIKGDWTYYDMCKSLISLSFGTILAAAGSQTLNQVIERHQDSLMVRTHNRPLATGRLRIYQGLLFAFSSSLAGIGLLYSGCGSATALIAASTTILYAGLYTPLKRITPYNTHIGALSGSLPVLLGFVAFQQYLPDKKLIFEDFIMNFNNFM